MKKKILIVDDKITIAKIIMSHMSKIYDFEYFNNPRPCIERLGGGDLPGLIISDTDMPNMHGSEFLYYLKGNDRLKHIPVIIMSSEDNISERLRFLENGAEDYILKPFNPMELEVRIERVLR